MPTLVLIRNTCCGSFLEFLQRRGRGSACRSRQPSTAETDADAGEAARPLVCATASAPPSGSRHSYALPVSVCSCAFRVNRVNELWIAKALITRVRTLIEAVTPSRSAPLPRPCPALLLEKSTSQLRGGSPEVWEWQAPNSSEVHAYASTYTRDLTIASVRLTYLRPRVQQQVVPRNEKS